MERYHITLGASTTAGGKVTSAASDRTLNGIKVAYEGDSVSCPRCNAEGIIEPDGPRISETLNGKQVALSDDICRCKCDPPPRLIANQIVLKQMIDGEWAAAKAGAAAETAAKLNTAANSAATRSDGIALVLLDPKTEEPYRNRRYKLSLKDRVIEGTTDQNGVTKPLTLAERASIIRWHVEDETAGA